MYDSNELYDLVDNHLEEWTSYEYISTHIEILPKLIAAYDEVVWSCYSTAAAKKLLNSILAAQQYLIPYLKKCFKENSFDFELDYFSDILKGLSSESVSELKDEFSIVAQDEKWHRGYDDFSFIIIKLLLKHCPDKKDFCVHLLRERLEKALKERTELMKSYPKDFISLDDYMKEETHKFFPDGFSSSREEFDFGSKFQREWMERHGDSKLLIEQLEFTDYYINEMNKLLNIHS